MNLIFKNVDEQTATGIREVTQWLWTDSGRDLEVTLVKTQKGLFVAFDGKSGTIGYSRKCELFRAIGLFTEKIRTLDAFRVEEEPAFTMLCLTVDNSRNAVLNSETAKRLIRILALMGYTSLMLYTEDTYEVPGHPYFGYMRGRFAAQDLRELDAYAQLFGIELIPCIQTLAHLNAALRWNTFSDVHDCGDILLAGEEKTYALIDDMLASLAGAFSSRKINIGMDEAELLGSGKYLDKNGFSKRSDIMLSHLQRVIRLCRKYDFTPMMWSDMFFKLAGSGQYYETTGRMPEEVIARTPQEVSLIYWDYYNTDEKVYEKMIGRHQEFHNPLVFAGGAWKWMGFAPGNRFSFKASRAGLKACEKKGVNQVILTTWGDNGAECSAFATLPVLQLYAEACYAHTTENAHVAERLFTCAQADLEDFFALDLPNLANGQAEGERGVNPSKYLFYQDMLCGLFDRHVPEGAYNAHFRESAERLRKAVSREGDWAYLFETMSALCNVLALKCDLGVRLKRAYEENDRKALRNIAETEFPDLLEKVTVFAKSVRFQWYHENKAFGFEVFQIRFGGLIARIREAGDRIDEYLEGKIDRIEELEEERLFYDCRTDERGLLDVDENHWNRIVTAGSI